MDIFLKEDVDKLLSKKYVVFLGDSNIRALYKDLLCLKRTSSFISEKRLKTKLEKTIFGDHLLTDRLLYNSRKFVEEREAYVSGTKLAFYFITRIYSSYVESILKRMFFASSRKPDVFIVNSCLWDITRWGPRGVESYKSNLNTFMKVMKENFPDCLVIWVSTPPVAQEMKGGFLVKELEFMKYSLRFHILEANRYARKVIHHYGFDLVDTHYHLKMQLKRRSLDGIHWMPDAVRYSTNLILAHICLAWAVPLPHRYKARSEHGELKLETKQEMMKIVDSKFKTEMNWKLSSAETSKLTTHSGSNSSRHENTYPNIKSDENPKKKRKLSLKSIVCIPQNCNTRLKD